jgi:hypothetical protein
MKQSIQLALIILLLPVSVQAQGPANGTTVFRCLGTDGIINYADAPCRDSASKRLRIEHSLIQSVPLSVEDQQRLNALTERLKSNRDQASLRKLRQRSERIGRNNGNARRCRVARAGLAEVKLRKRRGYPVRQAQRIDAEQRTLEEEISATCGGPG